MRVSFKLFRYLKCCYYVIGKIVLLEKKDKTNIFTVNFLTQIE